MKKGFVFGKYLPFHLGHKALINFALTQCDWLYIIVCCSNKEGIDGAIRTQWIRDSYPTNCSMEVILLNYDESELPNTSVSSVAVSSIWAKRFQMMLPEVDLLITSEKYGDYVAKFMAIKHLLFDQKRSQVSISATAIRASLHDNWHFLPQAVQKYYQQKIVLLGTESTGKSSLAIALSQRFGATLVEEVGREIISDSKVFEKSDLNLIAIEHAKRIEKACGQLRPLVIIDTDIHITQSYSKFQFGHYLDIRDDIYAANRANLYIYFCKDLKYVQDGSRLEETQRNDLDLCHRRTLQEFKIDYIEIAGNWEQRLEKSVIYIEQHLLKIG